MRATLSPTECHGFDAIELRNGLCRATVIPSLGGRVWELEDVSRGRQWIWHRPGVPLAASTADAEYDAVWAGGWEELFPNDAAGPFEGRHLPDHGEWWTMAWQVTHRQEGEAAVLRLEATTTVRRARCIKEISLRADEPTVRIAYRVESAEDTPFHFLFKQHLPVELSPGCRLVVPGGTVTPVDPDFGNLLATAEPGAWPATTAPAGDLSMVLPPTSRTREFVYVSALAAGWCGVDDPANGASLRFRFDQRRLPYLWLFLTYGGWRDCHTAVLEPCTNLPKDLTEAVRRGQSALLTPGIPFETEVSVTLGSLPEAG